MLPNYRHGRVKVTCAIDIPLYLANYQRCQGMGWVKRCKKWWSSDENEASYTGMLRVGSWSLRWKGRNRGQSNDLLSQKHLPDLWKSGDQLTSPTHFNKVTLKDNLKSNVTLFFRVDSCLRPDLTFDYITAWFMGMMEKRKKKKKWKDMLIYMSRGWGLTLTLALGLSW